MMKGPAVVSSFRLCTLLIATSSLHTSFADHHVLRHLSISPDSIILIMLQQDEEIRRSGLPTVGKATEGAEAGLSNSLYLY